MQQYTAQQILKVRDALVDRDLDEAYHQLYTLADPEYKIRANPWEDIERAAAIPSPAKAEQPIPKDSKFMTGAVNERFKELSHKGWDWKAFYNGWIEGRAEYYAETHDLPTAASRESKAEQEGQVEQRDESVEYKWDTFWKGIVCHPDGTINIDQLKKELHDFHFVMHEVPKVYRHVTGDRLSKIMYPAETVIGVADEYMQEIVDRELKDQNEDQEIDEQSIDSTPGKEAGQPALQVLQNFTLADIDAPTFTHTAEFRKHFDYIKGKFMEVLKEQPAPSGLRWINAAVAIPKGNDNPIHVKVDGCTRIGNFYEENGVMHFHVQHPHSYSLHHTQFKHIEWLSDSPAPVQVDPVELLEWLVRSGYNPMFIGFYLKGGNRVSAEELYTIYTQSLQNKP